MYQFSQRSESNLKGVHPNLVKVLKAAIQSSPVDFTIVEGVRTTKRQQELYALGRTRKGRIVTYADGIRKKSNHQPKMDGFGYAVDIYPFVNGKVQVHEKDTIKNLTTIAQHIKATAKKMKIAITWGGDWRKPYDPPHFELLK